MKPADLPSLQPRKTPHQARSTATVGIIFEATIQVLLADGPNKLTTTRVAERAGVSVGTLYQYFPHKQALLYAVLQHHLSAVATAVEAACAVAHGRELEQMAQGLVTAFVKAKTAHPDASRAMYKVAAELETQDLLRDIGQRMLDAVTTMLASAPDARIDDLPAVTLTLMSALAGTTRAVFERGATPRLLRGLRAQTLILCCAYLRAVALTPASA